MPCKYAPPQKGFSQQTFWKELINNTFAYDIWKLQCQKYWIDW